MAKIKRRKLPVGVQSFRKIREEGYLYVDKTDIVWELANNGDQYNYLSRPRRFGKSVLVDTLESYFLGRKDLFEGLKIMEMEEEWNQYPVIRLDMSRGGASAQGIQSYLNICFKSYEQKYNITPDPTAQLADRFNAIITTAYQQTGMKVVVLIDEYDSPLQHSWKTPEHEACTDIYRNVFAILKADDEFERFVFITGITKFTQISLFSVLNTLSNISFYNCYATICGLTKEEILENLKDEIQVLAVQKKWDIDQTMHELKDMYDGYHFSESLQGVYNPFSVISALKERRLRPYWIASGATEMLPKILTNFEKDVETLDGSLIDMDYLETADISKDNPKLVLYQLGFLTIKDVIGEAYRLGFPNREVNGFPPLR